MPYAARHREQNSSQNRRKTPWERPRDRRVRRWLTPLYTIILIVGIGVVVPAIAASPSATTLSAVAKTTNLKSPFVVVKGNIRKSLGRPTQGPGTEARLFSKKSKVTAVVRGSGRVIVAATGDRCKGAPQAGVSVDGRSQVRRVVRGVARYSILKVGNKLKNGQHVVVIRLTNDRFRSKKCDRNLSIGDIRMESSTAAPSVTKPAPTAGKPVPVSTTKPTPTTATSTTKPVTSPTSPTTTSPSALPISHEDRPTASNTGVPSGTALTVYNGDLTITKDGTSINGLDVRGTVRIKADNVTITRSVIRGGPAATSNSALVAAWWNAKNFRISDSTLAATNASLHIDGLSGSNFTATRLDISRVVDPVKVIGSNVTLNGSWLHDTIHSDKDPNQPDGRTHDDSVQVEGGTNITLAGNSMEDAHNAAIQVTQNFAATASLTIKENWLGGGVCTVNVTQRGKTTGAIQGTSISRNVFSPGSEAKRCSMLLPSTSPIKVVANVWGDDASPVSARTF